jgi:nitrite reductase/ring-hydroxylating ferredoxin subunit
MKRVQVAKWNDLEPLRPAYALVANVDLVVIRWPDEEQASVLYGRCQHRGALLADGNIVGDNLVCGLHNWDYNYLTGVSSYDPNQRLQRFDSWVEKDAVWVDEEAVAAWQQDNPQPYDRASYQGLYADIHGAPEEPVVSYIQ